MGLYNEIQQQYDSKTNQEVPSLKSYTLDHFLEEKGNGYVYSVQTIESNPTSMVSHRSLLRKIGWSGMLQKYSHPLSCIGRKELSHHQTLQIA